MATRFIAAGTETLTSLTAADVVNFPEGAQTVSAGMTQSGIGFVTQINAARRFIGSVGTAGNPLLIGVSGSINWDAGGGSLFITPACLSGNTIVNLTNSGFATVSVLGSGTVTNLFAAGGKNSVSESTTLTNLYCSGGTNTVEYNATGMTVFNHTAGNTTIRRPCNGARTFRITGGSVTFERKSTDASPGITMTSCTLEVGDAEVNLAISGSIGSIKLLHPNARLNWARVPAALTIATLEGNSRAIANSGLRSGAQTTQFGISTTVSVLTKYGKDVAQVAGESPAP